jgi:hypothetical protein
MNGSLDRLRGRIRVAFFNVGAGSWLGHILAPSIFELCPQLAAVGKEGASPSADRALFVRCCSPCLFCAQS